MIIVTGGAGFIGSHIISGLNAQGRTDIIAVDDLSDGRKFYNLTVNRYADYLDYEDFFNKITQDFLFSKTIDAIFHQGACVVTTEWNGRYMMNNNYEYSKQLLHYCVRHHIPLIYASSAAVYGLSSGCENPLNIYGYSKWLFDQYALSYMASQQTPIVGLRYFNVYGPRESHKKTMASVAYHGMQQLQNEGKIRLFGEYDGYGPGEQCRDFIFVEDVAKVNLWFLNHLQSGIFNVGTGQARTFNDLAKILIDIHGAGKIEYIPFPSELKSVYQSHTQADITGLRQAGYSESLHNLELGLQKYFQE